MVDPQDVAVDSFPTRSMATIAYPSEHSIATHTLAAFSLHCAESNHSIPTIARPAVEIQLFDTGCFFRIDGIIRLLQSCSLCVWGVVLIFHEKILFIR